jgi:Protein of unknown function (DUF4012)
VVAVLIVLTGAIGSAGAWASLRAVPARANLTLAGALLADLGQQLARGDTAEARATLAELQEQTRAATSVTSAADWRAGTSVPVVGRSLAAVRTVASVLDDLSRHALPTVVDLAGALQMRTFLPHGGRVNLAPLQAAAPAIEAVDATVRRDRDTVAAIATEGLLPAVRDAVVQLRDGLDRVRSLTGNAARAAVLMPDLLGANGSRTYLVLFQNLAEARATGGIAGAFLVCRADHGRLRIIDQGSAAAALMSFPRPVLPLDPGQRALYTDRLGTFPADVNLGPDFPTAAALAREMYRRRSGRAVDGVLATDPVALSYLLRATGPVPTPAGPPLTATNAVRVLLADAYARMRSTADKDAFFASAARQVFEVLSRGRADPALALPALTRSVAEHRLLAWSAHPEQQALISGTALAGSLPEQDSGRPVVGVFLDDGSGAKLSYYLSHDAQLRVDGCRRDGRWALRLRVTLGSTAPRTGLPSYVLGLRLAGDPYTVRTNVLVFSPAHGSLTEVRLDGVAVPFGSGIDHHRSVGVLTVDLAPGQRRVIDATLLTAESPEGTEGVESPDGTVTPDLWVTPGVAPWRLAVESVHICST